jgi:adenylate cyclase
MQESNVQRLSAVLFADVEGYSHLMWEDEAGTLRRFRDLIDGIVRPLLDQHGGRLVKTTGDGFIAEFSSALAAVECAIAIQNRVSEPDVAKSGGETLAFRMGINAGEVMVEADDIFGTEVNIAARLEKLAHVGEVVISEAVYRSARRSSGLAFEELGHQALKNITEPVMLYRVATATGSKSATSSGLLPLSARPLRTEGFGEAWTTQRPSVMITPFVNLSGDPEQEYFCNGLTFDLTTDLSRFKNLDVVAAQTALLLKDDRRSARELSAAYGISYFLEGSVQRTGDEVRINTQLIDARRDRHIWADRFTRPFRELPRLQDDLNRAIVIALAINVDAAEREKTIRKHASDMNAYDRFLKGLHLWIEHLAVDQTRSSLLEARSYFEIARSMDPQFARAWSTLAYTLAWGWRQGWEPNEALDQARHHASHAVRLEPDSHDTHWDLAYCLLTMRDFDGARREYETARRLNPYDVLLMTETAEFLCCIGEHENALKLIDEAIELTSFTVDYSLQTKAAVLYFLGDYEGALHQSTSVRQTSYSDSLMQAMLRARLAAQHAAEGKGDLAHAEQERAGLALSDYHARRSDRTADQEFRTYILRRPEDEALWRDGLRLAGLLVG